MGCPKKRKHSYVGALCGSPPKAVSAWKYRTRPEDSKREASWKAISSKTEIKISPIYHSRKVGPPEKMTLSKTDEKNT